MPTLNDLEAVFRRSLELPDEIDARTLAYRAVPQWDSVAHMRLVADLEEAFGVHLEMDEVVDLSSFEAARAILGNLGVRFEEG